MEHDERIEPVGRVHSPFREKFGIPRQPGLVPEAWGVLELHPPFDRLEAVEGLDAFSHLWLIYRFHAIPAERESLRVRPPRLGGNRRLGVFATRSMFRPSRLGLSVVALEAVEVVDGRARLRLGGVDLLDGTPVLDIKPYLPYADSLPGARAGFAERPPPRRLAVRFVEAAEAALIARPDGVRLRALITAVLSLDPRPAYRAGSGEDPRRMFGMRLEDLDVRWGVEAGVAWVHALQRESDRAAFRDEGAPAQC
jgi:tRNA-Thr(GGU) m(6)t(6)A37 methyltransferase TsaA